MEKTSTFTLIICIIAFAAALGYYQGEKDAKGKPRAAYAPIWLSEDFPTDKATPCFIKIDGQEAILALCVGLSFAAVKERKALKEKGNKPPVVSGEEIVKRRLEGLKK